MTIQQPCLNNNSVCSLISPVKIFCSTVVGRIIEGLDSNGRRWIGHIVKISECQCDMGSKINWQLPAHFDRAVLMFFHDGWDILISSKKNAISIK